RKKIIPRRTVRGRRGKGKSRGGSFRGFSRPQPLLNLTGYLEVPLHRYAVGQFDRQENKEDRHPDRGEVNFSFTRRFKTERGLEGKQHNGNEKQDAPRRRQFHEHRLKQRPRRSEEPA